MGSIASKGSAEGKCSPFFRGCFNHRHLFGREKRLAAVAAAAAAAATSSTAAAAVVFPVRPIALELFRLRGEGHLRQYSFFRSGSSAYRCPSLPPRTPVPEYQLCAYPVWRAASLCRPAAPTCDTTKSLLFQRFLFSQRFNVVAPTTYLFMLSALVQ